MLMLGLTRSIEVRIEASSNNISFVPSTIVMKEGRKWGVMIELQ